MSNTSTTSAYEFHHVVANIVHFSNSYTANSTKKQSTSYKLKNSLRSKINKQKRNVSNRIEKRKELLRGYMLHTVLNHHSQ